MISTNFAFGVNGLVCNTNLCAFASCRTLDMSIVDQSFFSPIQHTIAALAKAR
jgi:hypothetical protein